MGSVFWGKVWGCFVGYKTRGQNQRTTQIGNDIVILARFEKYKGSNVCLIDKVNAVNDWLGLGDTFELTYKHSGISMLMLV